MNRERKLPVIAAVFNSTATGIRTERPGPMRRAKRAMHIRKFALAGGKVLGMALLLQLMVGTSQAADHDPDDDDCQSMQVQLTPMGSSVQGHADICFGESGVTASLRAMKLIPGNAYTVWFSYIDQPQTCVIQGCGPADFAGVDPAIAFGRMDSAVAGRRGALTFSGSVRGLKVSPGSMIWLVFYTHGPASTTDNRYLARQLLTPQDPSLGAPGSGTTGDGAVGQPAAIAFFKIP